MERPSFTALMLALLAVSSSALAQVPAGVSVALQRSRSSVVLIPAGSFQRGLRMGTAAAAQDEGPLMRACEREIRPGSQGFWTVFPCFPEHELLLTLFESRQRLLDEPDFHLCRLRELWILEFGPHTVWLRAFGIDREEVTVGAYARCVSAGRCRASNIVPGSPLFGGERQPIVSVRWQDAVDYCSFVGGRLPTEAEWERAARGPDGDSSRIRTYPWGFVLDPRRANLGSLDPAHPATDHAGCTSDDDGFEGTAPVGSFPSGASPEGLLDMAGNAAEWVQDLWDRQGSIYPTVPTTLTQPTGAQRGAERMVRGGSWSQSGFFARTTYRGHHPGGEPSLAIGFRCAYDLDRALR